MICACTYVGARGGGAKVWTSVSIHKLASAGTCASSGKQGIAQVPCNMCANPEGGADFHICCGEREPFSLMRHMLLSYVTFIHYFHMLLSHMLLSPCRHHACPHAQAAKHTSTPRPHEKAVVGPHFWMLCCSACVSWRACRPDDMKPPRVCMYGAEDVCSIKMARTPPRALVMCERHRLHSTAPI
eukprot:366064-Chlamydomonas_euryale.AAC.7